MRKRNTGYVVFSVVFIFLLVSAVYTAQNASGQNGAKPSGETCYKCHPQIKSLKEGSRHAALPCDMCHSGLSGHLQSFQQRPVTAIDQAVCGKCHGNQAESLMRINYQAQARKEKGTPAGRSPLQEKLLAPHGFTKEHNEPRAHVFMVTDQFAVDRFIGGRFQYKKGFAGINQTGKAWDVLYDTSKELPETAKAGNATCIKCKTSDHILQWKYMGDKDPKAKWDRGSDILAFAKATQNPMGCIHCHDAHGAAPRVVRDALIDAIDQDGAKIFARGGKTDLKVIDFRGFRKIGVMSKTDSRMMCAQCHVEYACNAGFEFDTGKKIGYDDRRTNHYPLKNANDILAHYKKLNFYDFKHAVTGARLVKLQHPEAETYWGSVHDRAGIQCHQCHMPQAKDKLGRTYTNHGVIRPIHAIKEACLGCHPNFTEKEKHYQIEAAQNYIKGKMRKAEYWLAKLIDAYEAAQRAGVPEAALAEARERHEEAHVLWEWWTAENSDGWHNPDLARESLTASVIASKKGIEALSKARGTK
ncbi:MAG: ammonia-forming cytochrome c nitrite reductase subunit c552 [Deltaproteobacteria bacterium]|nr:ammonia-forming cytochrome c nitrite reductase subunit c552 [Deltaproteobacteria bacterium]